MSTPADLQVPANWFGQFDRYEPEGWTSSQWCWRHWAPAPVLGANGIQASLLVCTELTRGADSAEEADARLSTEQGKLCCQLGDERMYGIWGGCPPLSADDPWDDAALEEL